jgi:acyl-coenzyme A synthetase/AMP-(fatty) acid ligase/acyl carrier protein
MYPNLWKHLQQQAVYYSDKPFAKFGKHELAFDTLLTEVKALSMFLRTANNNPVIGINLTDPLNSITAIFASLIAGKAFWTTSDQIIEKTESTVLEDVYIIEEASYSQGLCFATGTFEFEAEIASEAPFCWATSSGSLATPKITEHSYYSLMEDTYRQIKTHNIGPVDKIDVISSLSFSAALSSIFPALFSGASLHFYNTSSLSITAIYDFWKTEKITMTTLIPTVFRSLLKYEYDFKSLDIRFICIGGEPVLISDIALFQEKFPSDSVLQVSIASSEARGIAEYITNTTSALPKDEIAYEPLVNKKLTIVGKDGQSLDSGQNGRIGVISKVIGSRYVQGPNNFTRQPKGEFNFTSDDIGSIGNDGKLRIESRANRLVKHKGEFIDLDQIKHDILQHDQILDCYVDLDKHDTVLRIVIYGLLDKISTRRAVNKILKTSSFQLYLVTKEFPKTHSGKLDSPLLKSYLKTNSASEYSDEDMLYFQQWLEIFPSETSFEGKHFFTDLGGDSISAVDLTVNLGKTFGIDFEPSAIYSYPYYEELFNYIKNAQPYTLKVLSNLNKELKNILLFPTLSGMYDDYLPIIDRLKTKYNFYLIKYPTRSDKRYESPDSIAKKCATMLNESNLMFTCFIGSCFSGYLAYYTAFHFGEKSGLILLDTHTYRKYGNTRKRLSDVLRSFQVVYQHAKAPSYLTFLLKRRIIGISESKKSDKKIAGVVQLDSPMQKEYKNFFKAFSETSHKLPQTGFPLGLFLADHSDNIRYRIEYDFNWKQYNSNIKFKKVLRGDHTHFSSIQENIETISNSMDEFVQTECTIYD